ncbi:hypothetical protein [Streptosporangium pseudovulgare]|uniref:DUF5709 domain-containing protein n=1 Tax=Streptosporangium pseudovulgare TaxID=35765 RepID=A0ABQ2QIB3_9ACTN|nr:hypothetical protein [Streptosporangium pseudovulgare]GGP80956.1 hypothetical protein GCM10010140_07200 [Streptosporangium pseudovulgare]
MSQPEENRSLADRRDDPEAYAEPDIAGEFTTSETDPAGQPESDPDEHVYGEAEGYERPTEV